MRNRNSLQFFTLACIIGIILSIGTLSFSSLTNAVIEPNSDYFEEGTWIGPVNVSGLNKNQTTQLLAKETATWKQQNQVLSQFIFEQAPMNSEVFTFDLISMVEKAKQGQRNQIVVSINEEEWTRHINELGFLGSEEGVNWKAIRSDLLLQAQTLEPISEPLYFTTYMTPNQTGVSTIAQATMLVPLSDTSLSSWVRKHETLVVEKGQRFSLNTVFESDPTGLYSEAFKTILASTLYKAALESPFDIMERQISVSNPNNIQEGFEAFIDSDSDLVLQNVYGFPLTIQTESSGNELIVSVIGPMLGVNIDVNPLQRKVLPYRVQIQTIDRHLPETTEKGDEGVEVEVSRIVSVNGENQQSYFVARDLYFPVHEIQYRHEAVVYALPTSDNSSDADDDVSSPSQGSEKPQAETDGSTSNPGTNVPPGGTSTDSDPDHILEEDQKKTTK